MTDDEGWALRRRTRPLCAALQVADACALPFADHRFDRFVANNVLMDVPNMPPPSPRPPGSSPPTGS